ncbi:MAG: hypothetical protein QOE23_358 [Pseudonocardiales bacterium]|jgi:DNA-binding SARP family transcriptional activator|nr:hypothetical protein [Pseudonocardiales bacterium]
MTRSRATALLTTPRDGPKLNLLGGFSLYVAGGQVALPMHSRRVLAYVCLAKTRHDGCDRSILAERLWPDVSADRSRASLRTAVWRIRQASAELVDVQPETVRLAPQVEVDVANVRETADCLMAGRPVSTVAPARVLLGSAELLPGWDETWLVLAREQLRQTRLHALEIYVGRLKRQGRYPEAIDAMLAVIADEPLRESAHAVLIDIHLSEGNVSEALRQFDVLTDLLWRELRLRPSRALHERLGIPAPPAPTAQGGTRNPLPRPRATAATRSA